MEDESIDNLLAEKENELKEIHNLKIKALQNKVREKDNQYQLLELKYQEMQQDFEHNLTVIRERDNDINELTENIIKLKEILEEKHSKIEEGEIQLETLKKENEDELEGLRNKLKGSFEKLEDIKAENKALKLGQTDEMKRFKMECDKKMQILQDLIKEHENTIKILSDENKVKIEKLLDGSKKYDEMFQTAANNFKTEKLKMVDEYNKKIESLTAENNNLREEYNRKMQAYVDREKEYQQKLTELKSQNKELLARKDEAEKEFEALKGKSDKWDTNIKEKIDTLIAEKEKLHEKALKTKSKYKNKINLLKNLNEKKFEELVRENSARVKKYEQDIKEYEIDKEKLMLQEKSLRERLQDLEYKLGKEQRSFDERSVQLSKNLEQDIKKCQHEIELKKIQYNHLLEEKNDFGKKIDSLQAALKDAELKTNELEKENYILVEEVAFFRKENPNIKFDHKQKAPAKSKKTPVKKSNIKEEVESEPRSEFEAQFSEDLGPASPLQSVESKSQFLNFNKNLSKKTLKNDSNPIMMTLAEQLKTATDENKELKDTIKKMADEMENVRYRMQTNIQELQNTKELNMQLRGQVNNLQQELYLLKDREVYMARDKNEMDKNYKEILAEKKELSDELKSLNEDLKTLRNTVIEKEQESATLKKSIVQSKADLERLKQERDQLIEISSGLRSKLNKLEDGLYPIDDKTQHLIQTLEAEIEELRDSLKKWQDMDARKQMVIDKLRSLLPKNIKYETIINQLFESNNVKLGTQGRPGSPEKKLADPPEKESINPAKQSLSASQNVSKTDNIKRKIEDLKNDLAVESKAKPLTKKSNEDPKLSYIPNSEKQTQSQKEIEDRMKRNRKKSPPLVRNYNQKEDNE